MRRPSRPSGHRPVLIVVSDMHLTLRPPVSRADPDWMEAMARPLREIRKLQKEHGCPVACAGDIFDKFNPPPELINFALRELPVMAAIPGQHDLPNHRYEDIRKSGYWTLVEANKVIDLKPGVAYGASDDVVLYGFPWGHDHLVGDPRPHKPLVGFNVAIIHSYVWRKGSGYPDAPAEKHIREWKRKLEGFTVAAFGDNHKGFNSVDTDAGLTIANCGGMMKRKSDEADYEPTAVVVWSDGTAVRHHFDTTADMLLTKDESLTAAEAKAGGFDEFMNGLRNLGDITADFAEEVMRECERRRYNADMMARASKVVGRHT